MSGLFVTTIIFAAIAIGLIVWWLLGRKSAKNLLPGWAPIAGVALTVVLLVFASLTMVGTRDIGIVTSFGRPVNHLDNGIHTKLPWQSVSTLDGAIQTDEYFQSTKNCVDARIGNESTACVDITIKWRINPDAADELYQDYRDMDNIRRSVVTRQFKAAINDVLSTFNPLTKIGDDGQTAQESNGQLASDITKELRSKVDSKVEVGDVTINVIHFDDNTQAKINSYQAEVANTRIAEQREKTAAAQAKANQALSASVSNDSNVLVAQCLNTFDEMVKEKQPIPAGFSCWPGGGSSLVVPATK